ncbi:signal peptidase I [Amycolatopsis regifaucium]|uniref:Signal peptidase I n=1 Tax=Amycolatopsis regifaucium TaxID=546365 RepID=A0ABX3E315_9PSEU|nr:signal peptidase I [Amycolatopsis regifaucium]
MVLAATLAAVLAGLRFRFVHVVVNGTSMLPTLRPGDRVLVRRMAARSLERGDLVVFARPREEQRSWMIKRVLAAPGDRVPRAEVPVLWGYQEPLVPPGRFVVVGDNPEDSYDSRQFGYLKAESLLGVVVGSSPRGSKRRNRRWPLGD